MNFKKSQSGRSMVEMLGVLAIIGVLSVGGIAGYSLSMRRHRANGVVDLASKYALVAYSNCQQKFLNGEVTDVTECNFNNLPTFENAGVGEKPAGVTGYESIIVSTDTTSGVDTVYIYIYFSDTKLCQAVASITGSYCSGDHVGVGIKQN